MSLDKITQARDWLATCGDERYRLYDGAEVHRTDQMALAEKLGAGTAIVAMLLEQLERQCPGRHHLEWVAYAGKASVWRCIHCPAEVLVDTTHEDGSAFMVCEHQACATRRVVLGIDPDIVDWGDSQRDEREWGRPDLPLAEPVEVVYAVEDVDEPCDGCTCCTSAGCHRGPGSECVLGGEGSAWEGESMCPCTEPVS